MEALIFLGAIVVIAIDAFIAYEFRLVAQEKGYESSKFFWIPFLFSFVGYLLVIALPDRRNTVRITAPFNSGSSVSSGTDDNDDDLPDL